MLFSDANCFVKYSSSHTNHTKTLGPFHMSASWSSPFNTTLSIVSREHLHQHLLNFKSSTDRFRWQSMSGVCKQTCKVCTNHKLLQISEVRRCRTSFAFSLKDNYLPRILFYAAPIHRSLWIHILFPPPYTGNSITPPVPAQCHFSPSQIHGMANPCCINQAVGGQHWLCTLEVSIIKGTCATTPVEPQVGDHGIFYLALQNTFSGQFGQAQAVPPRPDVVYQ